MLRALSGRSSGFDSRTDRLLASGQKKLVGTDIDSTTTETSDFGDLAWIGNGV